MIPLSLEEGTNSYEIKNILKNWILLQIFSFYMHVMFIALTYLKLLWRNDCTISRDMNENFNPQKLVRAFIRNTEMN